MRRAALLLALLGGCAAAPVVPEAPAETPRHHLARLLVDACTDLPTTDERVEDTDRALARCQGSVARCLRSICRELQAESCGPRYPLMETRASLGR